MLHTYPCFINDDHKNSKLYFIYICLFTISYQNRANLNNNDIEKIIIKQPVIMDIYDFIDTLELLQLEESSNCIYNKNSPARII